MGKKPTLAETHPELAAQWHPTKNGELTPDMVTCGSGNKVWWMLSHDDPETGKHFDFEWDAKVVGRVNGNGCPFLSGKAVWPGYNDLASKNPELAKQWHPTKNGDLTPEMVTCGSRKKVWWYLSYDDPETGKHFDFEWEAKIEDRAREIGCPFLSGKAVWPGYNDLTTKCPELAAQWHPAKNESLTPDKVTCSSNKEVWWLLPYDDPESGKHFDFTWQAKVSSRFNGNGCPFLSGREAWPGYNDLATKHPELAAQWHPTKNGDLTPDKVTCGCNQKVWWLLPYDDPETGRHFDFEWEVDVNTRTSGSGCPFLSGRAVWPGYNDLVTKCPDLAGEWHPSKNGELTPEMVTCGSTQRAWWLLPYDDSETGKHFDFEWEADINSRTSGSGCPFLEGKAVWPGYNDLASKRPDLAAEWHPVKNGTLMPTQVLCGSHQKIWWWLPYDDPETGKHFDFEWDAEIANRVSGNGCPFLSGTDVWVGFNDLVTKRPDLAQEWHPTKNGDIAPTDVTVCSAEKVWWYLPYDDPKTGKHFNFEWEAVISGRTNGGNGCPFLSGRAVWPGFNDLATKQPDIAREWHPTKNRRLTPAKVFVAASKKAWWKCSRCGHEWYASVKGRTIDGVCCPRCRRTIYYNI